MLRLTTKNLLKTSLPKRTTEFTNFLKSELALEQETSLLIDTSKAKSLGFETTFKGAKMNLSKNFSNTFSANIYWTVNGTVPDMNASEEEQDPVSYPDFTIELEKTNHKKLVQYECFFPDQIEEGSGLDFHVRSISLVEKDEKLQDQVGEPYYINTDNIDPPTYDQVKKYLGDIGFDQDFGDMVIDLSTEYEGSCYIDQLKGIVEFLEK